MIVYVVFESDPYEGCSEPLHVFDTEEKAKEWVSKDPRSRFYENMEIE